MKGFLRADDSKNTVLKLSQLLIDIIGYVQGPIILPFAGWIEPQN